MNYKLSKKYILRGWTDLSFGLVNIENGECAALSPIVFQVLTLCNGIMDMDGGLAPPTYQDIVKHLLNNKVIEECSFRDYTTSYQKYKKYPCRHIGEVQWSITGKCNYRCRHCFMSAPDAKYGEFSLEKCLDIVNQIEKSGIFQVMLTGGEPLVRKDFLTIVDALYERNITIKEIYSNGRLINDKLLDQLDARNIKPVFSISFDGVGWHDWLRGIPGAEEDAIRAFRLLQKRGFTCDVEMSLHKLNQDSIASTVKLLADVGVRQMKVSPTSESGKWMKEEGKYTLSTPELYDAYFNYVKKYKASGAPIGLMLGGFFRCSKGSENYTIPAMKFDGTEEMLKQPLCGSAHNRVYIAADGKVLPCIPLSGLPIQEIFPNLMEQSLVEILADSKYSELIEAQLKDLLAKNPKCADCKWKLICGGGCRAGALITSQEYLGPDETICYFFKENYQAKIADIYQPSINH